MRKLCNIKSISYHTTKRNISEKIKRSYLQKNIRKNEENPTSYVKLNKIQRKHVKIGHYSQKFVLQ